VLLLLINQDALRASKLARNNIEMVYKNIKLTSSGVDYKGVVIVVKH